MKNRYINDIHDQKFDFYYSKNQAQNTQKTHKFKGLKFTSATKHGEAHGCDYIDMEFVGTGLYTEVSLQK